MSIAIRVISAREGARCCSKQIKREQNKSKIILLKIFTTTAGGDEWWPIVGWRRKAAPRNQLSKYFIFDFPFVGLDSSWSSLWIPHDHVSVLNLIDTFPVSCSMYYANQLRHIVPLVSIGVFIPKNRSIVWSVLYERLISKMYIFISIYLKLYNAHVYRYIRTFFVFFLPIFHFLFRFGCVCWFPSGGLIVSFPELVLILASTSSPFRLAGTLLCCVCGPRFPFFSPQQMGLGSRGMSPTFLAYFQVTAFH